MTDDFKGKVVLITGGARGQGRAHALAFARRGADIAFCDVAAPIKAAAYDLATEEDIAQTVSEVEDLDRRCVAAKVDIRDRDGLERFAAQTVSELGRIDVLCANAGIATFASVKDTSHELWDEVIAINLTGTWNTVKAVLPQMLDQRYGRIVVTASSVARHPVPNLAPYAAAKTGLVSLVKTLSMEFFNDGITVNAVAPAMVATPMVFNEGNYSLFLPEVEHPTLEEAEAVWAQVAKYGDMYVQPEKITDGVVFLASDAAEKISGVCLDIQAGWNAETPV